MGGGQIETPARREPQPGQEGRFATAAGTFTIAGGALCGNALPYPVAPSGESLFASLAEDVAAIARAMCRADRAAASKPDRLATLRGRHHLRPDDCALRLAACGRRFAGGVAQKVR